MKDSDAASGLLIAKFEQHLEHARHVENERLAIVAGYIAITTAALAYFHDRGLQRDHAPMLAFLIVLSVACLALCTKIQLVFKHHASEADRMLSEAGEGSMFAALDEHPLGKKWWLSISLLFSSIFVLCSSAFVFALVCALAKVPVSVEAASLGAIVAVFWGAGILALVLNVDFRSMRHGRSRANPE